MPDDFAVVVNAEANVFFRGVDCDLDIDEVVAAVLHVRDSGFNGCSFGSPFAVELEARASALCDFRCDCCHFGFLLTKLSVESWLRSWQFLSVALASIFGGVPSLLPRLPCLGYHFC